MKNLVTTNINDFIVILNLLNYTEIAKVLPPMSPHSLPLPIPVLDNTARPPLSSSVETIASILGGLCLLATATAIVFVYRRRFRQSAKNNNHESEIALMQGTVWLTIAKIGKNFGFS